MAASLTIAVLAAVAYLVYDVALARGAALPGGDLRLLALFAYTVVVLVVGSVVTYLKTNCSKIIRNAIATTGTKEY